MLRCSGVYMRLYGKRSYSLEHQHRTDVHIVIMSAKDSAVHTPRENYEFYIIRYIRRPLTVIGCDVLDPDYQYGPHLGFTMIILALMSVSCMNTAIVAPLEQKIEVLTYVAICMQAMIKMFAGIVHRVKYRELVLYNRRTYTDVERSKSALLEWRSVVFSKWFVRMMHLLSIGIPSACFLIIIAPLIGWLAFGIVRMPILPVMLPVVSSTEGWGYWANQMLATAAIVFGTFGIVPSDLGFLVFVLHTYLRAMVLEHATNRLNEELQRAGNRPEKVRAATLRLYERVISMHGQYYVYV